MAVKIIKKGVTRSEKLFKGICSSCGTEIECLGSDLKTYQCDSQDPRERNYDYVKCPLCGYQIASLRNVKEPPPSDNS